MDEFVVAKWQDGAIEVTPQSWLEKDRRAGFWPSHITERTTLTSAVQHQEKPEKNLWPKHLITKVYGTYDTYFDALDKVKRMTSAKNLDISSSENESNTEDAKQRRRLHARKGNDKVEEEPPRKKLSKSTKSSQSQLASSIGLLQLPAPPLFLAPDRTSSPLTKETISDDQPSKSGISPLHVDIANKFRSKTKPVSNVQPTLPDGIAGKSVMFSDMLNNNTDKHTITSSKKQTLVTVNEFMNTISNSARKIPDSGLSSFTTANFSGESSPLSPFQETDESNSIESTESQQGFRAWVVQALSTLKVQSDIHSESLKSIKTLLMTQRSAVQSVSNTTVGVNVLWDMFPLKTVSEVKALDKRVRNEQGLKGKLVNLFASLGGKDVKSSTDLIMVRMFANSAAKEFSWQAGKKKENFSSLSFFKVVLAAVRSNPALSQATETEVKGRISYYLVHAKERFLREQSRNLGADHENFSLSSLSDDCSYADNGNIGADETEVVSENVGQVEERSLMVDSSHDHVPEDQPTTTEN